MNIVTFWYHFAIITNSLEGNETRILDIQHKYTIWFWMFWKKNNVVKFLVIHTESKGKI